MTKKKTTTKKPLSVNGEEKTIAEAMLICWDKITSARSDLNTLLDLDIESEIRTISKLEKESIEALNRSANQHCSIKNILDRIDIYNKLPWYIRIFNKI